MKKLSRITWKSSFSVGVEKLDEQHKKLFSIINKLMDFYESGEDPLPALVELGEYLHHHFRDEEDFMAEILFPGRREHSERHSAFIAKYMDFLGDYEKGGTPLARNLQVFLKEWLTGHVLRTDDPAYAAFHRKALKKEPENPHYRLTPRE